MLTCCDSGKVPYSANDILLSLHLLTAMHAVIPSVFPCRQIFCTFRDDSTHQVLTLTAGLMNAGIEPTACSLRKRCYQLSFSHPLFHNTPIDYRSINLLTNVMCLHNISIKTFFFPTLNFKQETIKSSNMKMALQAKDTKIF